MELEGSAGGGGDIGVTGGPVTAKTMVLMIKPKAVMTEAIVTPCSLNNVLILSDKAVSSCKILLIVSLTLLVCVLNFSLPVLITSSLADLSFSRLGRFYSFRFCVYYFQQFSPKNKHERFHSKCYFL